jgi:type III restriction enzyme
MSDRILPQIKARLSLRTPQADCLDVLADVIANSPLREMVPFTKEADPVEMLEAVRGTYPLVETFERDFPSLCFSLATGVGKTRLMGAFISWLYLTGRSWHFFVLAPNTTIYNKLIADFTPGTEKYVFKGIAEFSQVPPLLVTGENWEQGSNVHGDSLFRGAAEINIFNVDKINKDQGRIKTLREYIGQSYFEYLANLPDLVLLMDEAHRYRAKAGMKAVAELKPVLGLELTATPRSTGTRSERFKNVIYDYGLGEAMRDGYVKEPAVATRKDFRPDSVTSDQLERIKLEDGIHCHENVKAELDIYARNTGRPLVHPFMLVVAQETTHAEALRQMIESDDFFSGRYKGRVIRVDSNTRGEESDEATARLLSLETDTNTDIVIHVNMLKEGWDVRNLYTIVPLRVSASDILTEQTLGRGLRLPYGTRTGVEAVDTLTVIAHDRFDEVIKAARDPNSIISIKTVTVGAGGDVSAEGATVLESCSFAESALTGRGLNEEDAPSFVFTTSEERQVAEIGLRIIREQYERKCKDGISMLIYPDMQASLVQDVQDTMAILAPQQTALDLGQNPPDVSRIVLKLAENLVELTIEIPEIVVLPTREVTFGFGDFNLSNLETIAKQPMSDDIIIQHLRDEVRTYLARKTENVQEERPENYLVRHLIDFPEIDYDSHSDLLFKLSGQMLARLHSYLATDEDVENVLLVHGKELARFIFAQMKQHQWETPTDYRASISRGFQLLRPQNFNVSNTQAVRDFRKPVIPASDTRKHVFGGFKRCCYPYQKFDSSGEREFSMLIDGPNEPDVLRWMKPGPGQFRIEYASGQGYEPDFVVETTTQKLIVEIKARNQLDSQEVNDKARAAVTWIHHANQLAIEAGKSGKSWLYALVPDDAVTPSATLSGLMAQHGRTVSAMSDNL